MLYPVATPEVSVCPSTTTVEPAGDNGFVILLITALEACGFIEIVVPETVIAGEPGTAV